MTQKAKKLVIITENVLLSKVTKIILDEGATGYTVMSAGGVGSRNTPSPGQSPVAHTYQNIKIEIITANEDVARAIAKKIADKYFDNFSGIIHLGEVEVLYAHSL
jgi:nitrogen regulatory protein PII